jgi:hypothetical protein
VGSPELRLVTAFSHSIAGASFGAEAVRVAVAHIDDLQEFDSARPRRLTTSPTD